MDPNMGHIVGTEVPDVSVGLSSGEYLDSSCKQLGDRAYENHVTCDQAALPAKSFSEGVDQGLEYKGSSVVEHLEHRAWDDVQEAGTKIKCVQVVQELTANTEVVEVPKAQKVDQELESEKMDAKAIAVVETEGLDVSIRESPGVNLNSGPREFDREYEDHAAYEKLTFPTMSFIGGVDHSQEYDIGSSEAVHVEYRTTVDFHDIDTVQEKMVVEKRDSELFEMEEQAADTKEVEFFIEQVDQELVSEKMNAKVVPSVCNGGNPDLDSSPRQAGDRECGDQVAYEQLPSPVKSFNKGVNHGMQYEPDSSVVEQLEQRTAGDVHEDDTSQEMMVSAQMDAEVGELQEQTFNTEAVELLTEQEVHQDLVFEKMDTKVVLVEKVLNVSNGGHSGLDTTSRPAGDRECGDHADEQSSFPVTSFDKGVDYGPEYVPCSSVAGHLERRARGDVHEAHTDMEDVKEMQEQPANAVVQSPKEQEVDQELIHNKLDEETVHIVEPDVSDGFMGCSFGVDINSSSKRVGDREYDNHVAFEQPLLPVNSFVKGLDQGLVYEPDTSVVECLEHRARNDVEADTIVDVQEVQAQGVNTEAVELAEEQEVDLELVYEKMDAKPMVETEVPDVSVGGSPGADLISSPREVGGRDYGDHASYEQPSLLIKSFVKGVDNGLEYEAGFAVADHLEHRAADDVQEVDTTMEDVPEVQKEAFDVETIESREEQGVNEELISKEMDVGNIPIGATEVPEISAGYISGVGLDSDPRQVGDGEYGDHAACEQPPFLVNSFDRDGDQGAEYESGSSVAEQLEHRTTDDVHDVGRNLADVEGVEEQDASTEEVQSPEEQDQEMVSHSAKPRIKEEKNAKRASVKPGNLTKDQRVSYQLPPEIEGEFVVFDLVWGKVKSHPWWPGQIFHPSDSSEKAMKYYRKDCYLVAYFGDRTFAWNEASVLKPFRNHFPHAERQNNSEAFQNAVSCALEEVSRRVKLGLACSCLSEESYDKIKYQIVENTGIREESSKREGVDRSTGVDSFQPDKLKEYVRSLARFPTSGADRLELVVAKAQLLAFKRLKGCSALPEFQYYEGLLEYDADMSFGDPGMSCENEHADSVTGVDAKRGPPKNKHDLKDIVYQRRKEKSMTELMGESMYYFDGDFDSHEEDEINLISSTADTKRKASGFLTNDSTAQQSTRTISLAKVLHIASPNPQQSFKVGECIRRVASQLTGSSVTMKGCSEGSNKRLVDDADDLSESVNEDMTESTPLPSKESSIDDMLSQLRSSARDPMKKYSFLGGIISFFSEFRNLAVTTRRQKMRKGSGRKRKSSVPVGSPETFEFDDRNDSYWTDMVVQNNAEIKPVRRGRKRKDEQVVSGDPEKPLQMSHRKYSRRQYHHDNHGSAPDMPVGDERKLDLPTELMVSFGEMGYVPSEVNLNKMFRRFGPLRESETEVDMQSCRARVVFKKRSDAEVAYSSAAMFNIFGSALVNYQLNYTPVSFRTSSLALTDGKEGAT